MKRQIILDTETTGLETSEGHRIIEIGLLELQNRQFTNNKFHVYLNPGRQIDRGAQEVHGITNEFLKDKPTFSDIAHDLLNFIKESELIIHNAKFDIGFLDYEFMLLNKGFGKIINYCEVTDTLTLARKLHPGQKNSLDALCKRYGIDNSHRNLHGALLDADLLGRVYLAMTSGQVNLFNSDTGESLASGREKKEKRKQKMPRIYHTPVVHATDSEQQQHEAFLKKIAMTAGLKESVWEKLKSTNKIEE